MGHITKIKVRSYECDSYSHVNNAVYLNYLEYARMDYLNQIKFDYEGFTAKGYCLFVTNACISYKKSARLNQTISVDTRMVKRQAASGLFSQLITHEGEIISKAEIKWACINSEGRPCRFPKEFEVPGLAPDLEPLNC